MIGYIVVGTCLAVTSVIITQALLKKRSRKKEYSDWQVGDTVYLVNSDSLHILLGWEPGAFYIEKDETVHRVEWDNFNYNKSAIWRRNHRACEKAMGKDPGFVPGLGERKKINDQIDGKPIDLLSEIECQIYLKQALETENYELAEKIKKQMEKYR